MIDTYTLKPAKRRAVTKIRLRCVPREPEPNGQNEMNEEFEADPLDCILPFNGPKLICPAVGLVEKNRRLYVDISFMNMYRYVDETSIEDNGLAKSLTLKTSMNGSFHIRPWRHITQRLGSYGDLDIAVWSRAITSYYNTYEDYLSKYYTAMRKYETQLAGELKERQIEAGLIQADIERKYPNYVRGIFFANDKAIDMKTLTFSEGIANEMGYSIEGLDKHVKKTGFPTLMDENFIRGAGNIVGMFMHGIIDGFKSVEQLPEKDVNIIQKDGMKKPMKLKFTSTLRPEENGFKAITNMLLFESEEKDNFMALENEMTKLSLKAFKGNRM